MKHEHVLDDTLAVDARGLVRTFGDHRALDGLDLAVRRGESLGLLGPNGAGKTTTIRIVATMLAPSSGSIAVLGLDPRRDAAAIRARIGVVPQDVALYEELTARENLAFFARLHGLDGARLRDRCAATLETAGLVERADERVKGFSGGMKRRLNLVAALLHEPEVLFLDEPTVGVDPQSRQRIYEMLDRERARGVSLVYTTHQLGEVERLCDRIVVLDHGRAIATGTLDELRVLAGASVVREAQLVVGGRARDAVEVLARAGIEARLDTPAASLEDVFLALTGRELRDDA